MTSRRRAVGTTAESAAELTCAVGLLASARPRDGDIRAGHLAVGFASGFLYRHARFAAGCRRLRQGPVRSVSITLAWAALAVAVDRSIDGAAARRAVGAGFALGSFGYRLVRRDG